MIALRRIGKENVANRCRWPIVWLSVACAFSLGAPAIPADKSRLAISRDLRMQNVIISWLECIECTDGELKAVVRLGPLALASLGATLRKGPSPASREGMRRYILSSYERLKEYQTTHPDFHVGQSKEEYIAFYMSNYDAQHRSRAAMALAAIGGPGAKKALALPDAEVEGFRSDVQKTVVEAQRKVAHDSPAK
jgi:predicted small lipoprotein YifL